MNEMAPEIVLGLAQTAEDVDITRSEDDESFWTYGFSSIRRDRLVIRLHEAREEILRP
jgi:hypothetical protein